MSEAQDGSGLIHTCSTGISCTQWPFCCRCFRDSETIVVSVEAHSRQEIEKSLGELLVSVNLRNGPIAMTKMTNTVLSEEGDGADGI